MKGRFLMKGEFIGYISIETCNRLQNSKQLLQEMDANIKRKIAYYVSIGKTEAETNALIVEDFMATFISEYEKYRSIEAEIRIMLNCNEADLFHIDFNTGAVIRLKNRLIN